MFLLFPARLLLRVYLFGVLMLLLAGAAIFVVGAFISRPPTEIPTRPSSAWIAWRMMDLVDSPTELQAELADLKNRSKIELSIYQADGKLLASSAARPPGALSPQAFATLRRQPTNFGGGTGTVAALDASGNVQRYVRLTYPTPDTPLTVTMAQLLAALGVLAAMSVLFARAVTRPLERLVELTREFGRGNLAVRAQSERRDELGALAQSFDEMADRLTQLRRTEKELLANVSHELRTPLSRIRVALDLIGSGGNSSASYLVDIEEDLAELERLLDDITASARLDLQQNLVNEALPPLRLERVPARRLLDAAQLHFRRHNPERSLHFVVADDLPDVAIDLPLLRRAVDNLLDNAVKFSEATETIRLEGLRDTLTGSLLVQVSDRGVGIEPEDLKRVFEPFFRADRSRTRATGGFGLGLTLAARIVHAHGGELTAQSDPEQGTRFSLRVPAVSPSLSESMGAPSNHA